MKNQFLVFLTLFFISFSLLAQQICDGNRPRSTKIENFQLTSSGFVVQKYIDQYRQKISRRYWMACSLGQLWTGLDCVGEKKAVDYKQALDRVSALRYAGFDDWRLPTIEEFRSIVEWQCESPAVDKLFFPGIDYYSYWTKNASKKNPDIIWVIDFDTGQPMYAHMSQARYIVAVRDESDYW